MSPRRPILYKGEQYSSMVEKKTSGRLPEPKTTYEEARQLLLNSIEKTSSELVSIPKESKLPNEQIICLRMHSEFSAKSYYPSTLFSASNPTESITEIGSRAWKKAVNSRKKSVLTFESGKLFFIRTTTIGLNNLKSKLLRSENRLTNAFKLDVRKISELNLLDPEEQILGFPKDWKEGKIEAVLHPFNLDQKISIQHFLSKVKQSGISAQDVKYKQYEEGITFLSLPGTRDTIAALKGYNPLRTIHPLVARELPEVNQGAFTEDSPNLPKFTRKPSIYLGIFDGGLHAGNPALDNYVENIDLVSGYPSQEGFDHGSQVVSSALYGPINDFDSQDELQEPSISIKNFRVVSEGQQEDRDLYEIIDAIEEVIPKQDDIFVYSLSLGPKGPILDDYISRFTFSCDYLSKKHNVLICAAAGNDGEELGYNRIQSPADMVNGLAVGSYTHINGAKSRAPYSCIGPGREGNKSKPDVLAFGGCPDNPVQLVSVIEGSRIHNAGTSFASPIVASAAAQLIGNSNGIIDSLLARTLIIHSAERPITEENDIGHGFFPDNIMNIIECKENSYTLIYQGEIKAGKYAELKIPYIDGISKGKVKFKWTSTVLSEVDPQRPDDYTTSSIETTFYPNSHQYNFKKGNKNKRVDISANQTQAAKLLADGYVKPQFPVSESATNWATEAELRANFKWDSVDQREITKSASKVKTPIFHIHALSRGKKQNNAKVKFSLVLTLQITNNDIDVYDNVVKNYSALLPLKLNIANQLTIKNKR